MSQPALAPYQAVATEKATITTQTTKAQATAMQSGYLLPRPPVNPRSITARLLMKKAGGKDRVSVAGSVSSYMNTSPGHASRHDEYSSHNATLTVPVGPVPHRFNSVAQLRTERAADRGDLHLAVRPELATFQASDRKANMTAQISAPLLNDRSTTAVDRNTLTNPAVTHGESSRRILPRYSTGASTPWSVHGPDQALARPIHEHLGPGPERQETQLQVDAEPAQLQKRLQFGP